MVGTDAISRGDVESYVTYAARYYRASGLLSVGSNLTCPSKHFARICQMLERQALARLIEERTTLAYAARHHIALTPQKKADARQQAARLAASSPTLSRTFLQSIVERELLVQAVERSVARGYLRGRSYHLRVIVLPAFGANRAAVHREAAALAADGGVPPPDAEIRVEWVAAFRLGPELKSVVQSAMPGNYLGPFKSRQGYRIVEYLGAGERSYGLPAQIAIEHTVFARWLAAQIHKQGPRCFDQAGKPAPCPSTMH